VRVRIYDADQRHRISGYGVISKNLGSHLARFHEVSYFPDSQGQGQDVVLWLRPPHYVKYAEFQPENVNVFYTMHETETFTGWKADWPDLLNRCDAIITPTEWNRQVFQDNGVTVPIHVVPLGIDSKVFHGAKYYEFSILCVHEALGRDGSRENWGDTLAAYHQAFYGHHAHDILMTIKSWNVDTQRFQKYLDSLRAGKDLSMLPAVRLIDLTLPTEAMNDLYAKHHLFVKHGNREGWAYPLWEAIAAGLRVAYASLPVFDGLIPRRFGRPFPLGDVEALKAVMLSEFNLWRKRKMFINEYSWKRIAPRVAEVLEAAVAAKGTTA
jgi:glycosyltransferase involved in cell wall biosynthesis